jgi:hypothetical protein
LVRARRRCHGAYGRNGGELHGQCLRLICLKLDRDFESLGVAARAARRHRVIDDDTRKWLERFDAASAAVRHLTEPKLLKYVAKLSAALNNVEPKLIDAEQKEMLSCEEPETEKQKALEVTADARAAAQSYSGVGSFF